MSETDFTAEQQRPAHLFKPGQSGNPAGRPKGARSKFSEAFISDLHDCWEEHGAAVLERVARDDPSTLLRVAASLMPKDISLNVSLDASVFADRWQQASMLLGHEVTPPLTRRSLRKVMPKVIDNVD